MSWWTRFGRIGVGAASQRFVVPQLACGASLCVKPWQYDRTSLCMDRPLELTPDIPNPSLRSLPDRMFGALRDADVAGMLRDNDLRRLASAAANVHSCVDATLRFPSSKCPGCDKESLKPRHPKSTPAVVLDTDGVHTRNHTPVRCRESGCRYDGKFIWHNFVAEAKGEHVMLNCRPEDLGVIMTSVTFGVTRGWYLQFSKRLHKHFASFSGEAEVHHSTSSSPGLSVRTLRRSLQDAWLKISLFQRRVEMGASGDFRLDLPASELIKNIYFDYEQHMRRRRLAQVCAMGYTVTCLIIDGHQKLTRRTCAEILACELMGVPELGLRALIPCPDAPAMKSCFCEAHDQVSTERLSWGDNKQIRSVRCKAPLGKITADLIDVAVTTSGRRNKYVSIETIPADALRSFVHEASVVSLRDFQRRRQGRSDAAAASTAAIDDAMTLAELAVLSCQTHKMGKPTAKRTRTLALPDVDSSRPDDVPLEPTCTRARRTGGFLAACTSKGVVVDVVEFYGSESLSQRYLFVARLRQLFPHLNLIIHDDACHLRRFADKRHDINEFAKHLAYPEMRYIIDRFHARGHVDAWCLANCHPKAPEVQGLLDGINTSICEITFARLSRYKHMFRKMGRWTGQFFVQEVMDSHNIGLGAPVEVDTAPELAESSSETDDDESDSEGSSRSSKSG